MDRVFLDANVLFSAAYREKSGLLRLWKRKICLLTSDYALEEARRNLTEPEALKRLDRLVESVEVCRGLPSKKPWGQGLRLPEKDEPILAAAILAEATHLLTGDVAHFKPHFGKRIHGVRILRPAEYLAGVG